MNGYMVFDGNVPIEINQHGQVGHAVRNRDDGLLFVRPDDARRFRMIAAAQVRVYDVEHGLQVKFVEGVK